MKRIFYILFIHFSMLHAQDVPVTTQLQSEQKAEAGADMDDAFLQQLDFLQRHPIQLNTASKEDFLQLPLLNDWQIMNFLSYRKLAGKLIDLHELQAVPGWDVALIQKILPYVTINGNVNAKENFLSRWKGEHVVLMRSAWLLQKNDQLAQPPIYGGSKQHLLFRYRYQYKDLLFTGITGDKDAGEQFFRGYQKKGFDFYSFHFFLKKMGLVKALALGDYTISLGQGLLSWQATGFGKSGEVMSVKKSSPVLLPYRSAGESGFYRGAGITISTGRFEWTSFVSFKRVDAHVDDSSQIFTGINASGLHRTLPENLQKNRVSQFTYGGCIRYRKQHLELSFNSLGHGFSIPMLKKDESYNTFAFSGATLVQGGIDYGYTIRNLHFFGELASGKNFQPAIISGLMVSMDQSVDLSLVYRKISRRFYSLFGNAFTENSLPVNESGIYTGLDFHPPGKWRIQAYADFFTFPWLKFRVDAPSIGRDYLVAATYHPSRQSEIFIQFRNRAKPLNAVPEAMIDVPLPEVKSNLRASLSNQLSTSLSFTTRFEVLWYQLDQETEQGFLGYVQSNFTIFRKLKTVVRYQYFETHSFNSRIYSYEPDVLSGFSIPAFSGKGSKFIVILGYAVSNKVGLWCRWARLKNRTLSADPDPALQIHDNELKLQFQVIL